MSYMKFMNSEEVNTMDNIWRIGVFPDGSCFFHSICLAFSEDYRNMDDNEKKKYVEDLRESIAELFTKELYDEIKEEYRKAGVESGIESYSEIKNSISDYETYVGDNVVLIVSRILGINIFIFDIKTGRFYRELYIKNFLTRNNPSCMIGYISNHYELLGKIEDDTKDQVLLKVIINPDDRHQHSLFSLLNKT